MFYSVLNVFIYDASTTDQLFGIPLAPLPQLDIEGDFVNVPLDATLAIQLVVQLDADMLVARQVTLLNCEHLLNISR